MGQPMTLPQKNATARNGVILVRFNTIARELAVTPRTLTRFVERGIFPAPEYLGRHKVYKAADAEAGKKALLKRRLRTTASQDAARPAEEERL
jgi:hypothetical protein